MQRFALALFLAASSIATPAAVSPIRDVIEAAAAAEGEPVMATVEFVVKGTGRQRDIVFLNSEKDYRDQRNISIELLPSALADLDQRFGPNLLESIKGQRIRVEGNAYRATIWFFANGQRASKYYFQTHLTVSNGAQVQRVLEP